MEPQKNKTENPHLPFSGGLNCSTSGTPETAEDILKAIEELEKELDKPREIARECMNRVFDRYMVPQCVLDMEPELSEYPPPFLVRLDFGVMPITQRPPHVLMKCPTDRYNWPLQMDPDVLQLILMDSSMRKAVCEQDRLTADFACALAEADMEIRDVFILIQNECEDHRLFDARELFIRIAIYMGFTARVVSENEVVIRACAYHFLRSNEYHRGMEDINVCNQTRFCIYLEEDQK